MSEMPEVVKAKLIKNIEVAPKYYKIKLACSSIAKRARPGQFLEVKVSNTYEPLLRRPLGINRVNGASIEILYEVVGRGTEILSQRKPGEYLDVIGPLGNGFSLPSTINHQPSTILVAGGMGVAPLVFLAEKLAKGKGLVLIGAKTKRQILCEKEFKDFGFRVKVATDDGSRGFKGKVTDVLKHLLSTIDYRLSPIYGCGPRPMLKRIAQISGEYNIPAQISLEEHLACGIGACLGCVIDTKQGYKRVCKEGPVFNAQEIIW